MRHLRKGVFSLGGVIALLMVSACGGGGSGGGSSSAGTSSGGAALPAAFVDRCTAAASLMTGRWPDTGTRIETVVYHPANEVTSSGTSSLPAHCEINGITHERTGIDGQNYAIRFRVRLPETWGGRFLMQGGGGTNGSVGDAIGDVGGGEPNALTQGYAVLAQDSGHNDAHNSDPAHGGSVAFGFDPQARADYGGVSLKTAVLAAKAIITRLYGSAPAHSYFVGCSKGGQEGMMLAQRYPDLFDGIIAEDPGFSLPKAALAEAWNTQQFAAIPAAASLPVTNASIGTSFSVAQGNLVAQAVLDACDGDDGLVDGIIGNVLGCTTAKVLPRLQAANCSVSGAAACLSDAQIAALVHVHDGLKNSHGDQVYPGFPWDAGWLSDGWRAWMTGPSDGSFMPYNVWLGAASRAVIFSTPPAVWGDSLTYQLGFNADTDTPLIYATTAAFPRSSWDDIGARSSDLSAFRAHGGKIIVPHGMSDPVFSAADTIAWWEEVNIASGGNAATFARVFPVPGMCHCGGGPSTDNFDAFGALVNWVEHGSAPDQIMATAGWDTPWPGRTRPLCRYPLVTRASGAPGSETFSCTTS